MQEDVERVCSASGCTVLARGMRFRSCGEYCGRHGLACEGAWEEHDDSCFAERSVGCGARLPTDDLLCQCAPGAAPGPTPAPSGRCHLHRGVERVCSPDGCKVLVKGMKHRSCGDYCSEQGLRCAGAWEEDDDSCVAEHTVGCDARLDTDDLLCECLAS